MPGREPDGAFETENGWLNDKSENPRRDRGTSSNGESGRDQVDLGSASSQQG